MDKQKLWLRWVTANAVGELLGLARVLFLMGAVVGAIHGAFLVRLAGQTGTA